VYEQARMKRSTNRNKKDLSSAAAVLCAARRVMCSGACVNGLKVPCAPR